MDAYVPRLALSWLEAVRPAPTAPIWQAVEGTMVFADISGFTRMSERLSRHGKVGAEEVTDAINACFTALLAVAYEAGGSLLKFGGDALLLLFDGAGHARRAAQSAVSMRSALRTVGHLETSAGRVQLRISMGAHSGTFHIFAVGDSHRELMVVGPAVSATVAAEAAASAGRIVATERLLEALPGACRGAAAGESFLLRQPPGAAFAAPAPAPVEAEVDGGQFLSTAIRRHLLEDQGHSEHRVAGVAFVHFDGTDALLATGGPEAVAIRLDELVAVTQRAADDHQVTFLGSDVDHDGGKLILAAGVPRRVGDDEERLLSALRAVADADTALAVRIGVHAGAVFAGDVGPRYRRTFTVMGDTVNLAARLMAKARPGQILASRDVLERSRLTFDCQAVAPFLVKGKKRPVEASVLGAPRGRWADAEHGLPFVGRADELGVLAADLAAAQRGSARVVDVVGESGVGKSRLAAELRRQAAPAVTAVFMCKSYESASAYAAVSPMVRWALGLGPGALPEVTGSRLRDFVERQAPALAAWLPLLGNPLGVVLDETAESAALEPEFRRRRTDRALAELLRAALPDEALVVVEDTQHMDGPSRGVLAELARILVGRSVMLVTTRRPLPQAHGSDDDPTLPVTRTLTLSPLAVDDTVAAIEAATETDPLLPAQVRILAERCDGNPLFLTELLHARRQDTSMEDLPASVDAALTAHIDRLPGPAREVLRVAAVLGDLGTEADLVELLRADGRFLPPDTLIGELGAFLEPLGPGLFRFRSGAVREAAYEALPYRRRRDLHVMAAALVLERRAPEQEGTTASLLSLHYSEAQRPSETWRYATEAGASAATSYANAEAITHFKRALTAAARLPGLDASEVADAWRQLGDVLTRASDYPGAAAAYREARRRVAGDPLAQAVLMGKAAQAAERGGSTRAALRWFTKGLRLLEGRSDPAAGAVRADLAARLAADRFEQGRLDDTIRWAERAIAEARASGARAAEAYALTYKDWAWGWSGRWDEVTESPRALAIYEELGQLPGQSLVINNMGIFAYLRGAWDEAVDLYDRARQVDLRMGADSDAAIGACNIAEVLADQGYYEQAERILGDALRVVTAAGYRMIVGHANAFLGRVLARSGRFSEAHERFAIAEGSFRAAEGGLAAGEMQSRVAELLALEGRGAEALALADTLLAELESPEGGIDTALLHRVRGVALAQSGDLEAARQSLSTSVTVARSRGADYDEAVSSVLLARVEERLGLDGPGTASLQARAKEITARLGVVRLPDFPLFGALARA